MVLSEAEAERRLHDLRRQREAIDRIITDLTLYLELGRRLGGLGAASNQSTEHPARAVPSDAGGGRSAAAGSDDRSWIQASAAGSGSANDGVRSAPADRDRMRGWSDRASEEPPRAACASGAAGAGPSSSSEDISEGAAARRYGRALIQAAVTVLEEAGRPLHVSEIVGALSGRGFSIPGQQDPVAGLNTRLWKRSGPGGPVRRLGDAVYALRGVDRSPA